MSNSYIEETNTEIFQEIRKRRMHEEFLLGANCGRVMWYGMYSIPMLNLEISNHPDHSHETSFRLIPFGPSDSHPAIQLQTNDTDSSIEYSSGTTAYLPESITKNGVFSACGHGSGAWTYDETNAVVNSTCLDLSIDPELWFTGNTLSDHFGTLNGTETTCSSFLCIRRIFGAKIINNQFLARGFSTDTRWYRRDPAADGSLYYDPKDIFCSGHDDSCMYSWTRETLDFLGSWILSTIDTDNYYRLSMAQKDSPGNNHALLYESIAAQLSALLQSQANPSIANFTGTAYGTEIYVQVNWLWFILPLVLLTSCLIILVLSIWDSSRKDYLFKNNILAAIAFDLHGWEPHEYGVDETWTRHSMRNVEKKAERMVARMQLPHEGDGGLRLKRE